MRVLVACFVCCALLAQDPEAGQIVRSGDHATLTADSGRPLDSAAITLANELSVLVNVEDPPYLYKDDVQDVTAEVSRAPRSNDRVLIPRGGPLDISFQTEPNGKPSDARSLLDELRQAMNTRYPFAYRLDEEQGLRTFVPTRTRNADGRSIEIVPLLDRRVNVASGTRSVLEHARLVMQEVSRQAGIRVDCCQSIFAGVPWGLETISFEAHEEPARTAFIRLIRATRGRFYWLMRCGPGAGFCLIDLRAARVQ